MSETINDDDVHSEENVSNKDSQRSKKSPESLVESGIASEATKDLEDEAVEDSEEEEIKDVHHYVFFIFAMFGFGSLLPWNMFLNISFDYYTMFKLREDSGNATWFSSNFQNSMTISAQIPSLAFSVINVFIAMKGDLTRRMRSCLIVVQSMVVVTIIFIYIETSSCEF
ncbi:hypothetical protein L3Y34_009260 [Caenorhabditis briggsae]|uniref:Uncharacterized protein n=1 Tax=Caenorhabditis briggsae TaxID=6238 RepID=A0AAE9A3U8_CAEBR|nr:hypothetical protein L3Y34_009260 [Caenorhabditis briggsae]